MPQEPVHPVVFVPVTLVFAVSLVFFCSSIWYIVTFWRSSGDFAIISERQDCEQPLNNRCTHAYLVKRASGENDIIDAWLIPGVWQFPEENRFRKKAGSFRYLVNDHRQEWPDLHNYFVRILVSVVGFLFWLFLGGPKILFGWLSDMRKQMAGGA